MPIRKQYTTRRARSRRQKYRTGGSKTKSSSNRKRSPSSSSSPSTTKRARMESPPAPITVTAPNLVKGKHYTGPSLKKQKVYGVVNNYPNDGVTQIYVIDKHGNSSYKTVSNRATYTEEKNVKKEVFAKELQVGEIYKALNSSSPNAKQISGKEILQKSYSYDHKTNQIIDVVVQVERDGPMIKLKDDDKFYEYSDDILPFMNREELLEFHDAICKSDLNNSTATVFGNTDWIRELCENI